MGYSLKETGKYILIGKQHVTFLKSRHHFHTCERQIVRRRSLPVHYYIVLKERLTPRQNK